jgi:DNA-binding response OmpR family regulator
MMLRILLYELDRQLNQDYRRALTSAGFTVRSANSGAEIGEILTADGGDFLITELEPGDTGLEIIKTLHQSDFYIPIIVVTDRDDFNDMKKAFEAGADDYMTKPARMEEMILRIRAVMRRAGQLNGDRHSLGKTTVNYSSMRVETPEGTVILPQKEFLLLYQLFSFPGRAFTKQQLKDDIWGFESNSDMHTVEVHIGRLREKFEENPDFEIETVRGVGYKVVPKEKTGQENSQ